MSYLLGLPYESPSPVASNPGLISLIDQFRYIKIQPKTLIDLSARLLGINYRVFEVFSLERRAKVYCCRLNFSRSNLGYKVSGALLLGLAEYVC